MVNILESCQVAPLDTLVELSLPLSFSDMTWVSFHPLQNILFYEFECSKSRFTDTIIQQIKDSLALTLKHFLPLAGHFVYPLGLGMPEMQYNVGDSVSVAFTESNDDFGYLTENYPRDAERFYPLVPQLPSVIHVANSILIPMLAVKVTLFPNMGISIGFTNLHVIGDANAMVSFIRAWTSICRFDGDREFLATGSLPIFDRSLIRDVEGLAEKSWNQKRNPNFQGSFDLQIASRNKVRATFVMEDSSILKLKNLISSKRPYSHHPSTFIVTCAYVWTCFVKANAAVGEDDSMEYFICAADLRARLDPPLPATYYGNCLGPCYARSTCAQLLGNEGFLVVAEVIAEAIYERLHNGEGVLKGVKDWPAQLRAIDLKRALGVAGSPRFDVYDTDFGWGRPKKFECLSIDTDRSISLSKSRYSDKDLDVGLSLPKIKMDAFASIFTNGLNVL